MLGLVISNIYFLCDRKIDDKKCLKEIINVGFSNNFINL